MLPVTVRASQDWGLSEAVPGRKNRILSSFGFGRDARINTAFDESSMEAIATAAAKYAAYDENVSSRRPNNFSFFEAAPDVVATGVQDLWASSKPIPTDAQAGWEIWLRPEEEVRFRTSVEALGRSNPAKGVTVSGVLVIAMEATRDFLERVVASASIAQLRPASRLHTGLISMRGGTMPPAAEAAARRVVPAPAEAACVCLLDTGVSPTNPLLSASLRFQGQVGTGYHPNDYDGHGTNMAGVALFDDLPGICMGTPAHLDRAIESVAVQGPMGAPAGDYLPASAIRNAVNLVEMQRRGERTFCLAMNAPDEADDGSPSSLSCTIDELSFDAGRQRLFCVAAGNIIAATDHQTYQALNEVTGMLTPAQAWNAISVSACTDLDSVPNTHRALAPAGDLSPWSATAVNWEHRLRPASKPDVVFEGGNQMVDLVTHAAGNHADLFVLTTGVDPEAPLTLTGQTSAATAAIAGLCVSIQSLYPKIWPETIRALVAHSASHTEAMRERVRGVYDPSLALLRRFGYGRANRERALHSAKDALTLMVQGSLRPLALNKKGNGIVLGEMRFHDLPWPREALETVAATESTLTITLSYFVDPNQLSALRPGIEQYASHGLAFDLRRADESDDEAISRINQLHGAARRSTASMPDWVLGPKVRDRGSLRQDIVRAKAGELARMGALMVFPRKGWWGERSLESGFWQRTVRYSAVLTIRTKGVDVYTPVENAIKSITGVTGIIDTRR